MIGRKVGEVFKLPIKGVTTLLRVTEHDGCVGCFLFCTNSECFDYLDTRGYCAAMVRADKKNVIFVEETSLIPPSIPVPSLSGMDEAFRRHVLSVARAEFVALFWDMQNTDLAAAMGVTEKTVRNIRKKRLRKNKDSL